MKATGSGPDVDQKWTRSEPEVDRKGTGSGLEVDRCWPEVDQMRTEVDRGIGPEVECLGSTRAECLCLLKIYSKL